MNPVQGYNKSFFIASVELIGDDSTAITAFDGLADFGLEWNRPISLYKALDRGGPAVVPGKGEGRITLRGLAVAGVTGLALTSTEAYGETFTSIIPTQVVVQVSASPYPGGAGAAASYTAYNTGGGFVFRQIAERTWVMDGMQILELVE